MKIMHLSDLHLGKRLNGFSLMEDQAYILQQILGIIDGHRPDVVIVAGDVYDKTVPSAEAVALLDDFLCALSERQLQVLIISGNHDSPERIAFGGRLMAGSGIHLSPTYNGKVEPVILKDAHGKVAFWLLPFVKPVHVRHAFPEAEGIECYTDAMRVAVAHMDIDHDMRNVLVTHQFVTGAETCDSEELSVGGTDNVDGSVFDGFDYVALGHIHKPQKIGRETMRYCGTPLKYSFSEAAHQKSVPVIELGPKGTVTLDYVPLTPLRDLICLRGTYMELTAKSFYDALDRNAYYHITLTDEEDVPEALGKLRVVYPNLMKLEYDNTRTRSAAAVDVLPADRKKHPFDLFSDFYTLQNGREMSEDQQALCRRLIEQIWGNEPCGL